MTETPTTQEEGEDRGLNGGVNLSSGFHDLLLLASILFVMTSLLFSSLWIHWKSSVQRSVFWIFACDSQMSILPGYKYFVSQASLILRYSFLSLFLF